MHAHPLEFLKTTLCSWCLSGLVPPGCSQDNYNRDWCYLAFSARICS